MIPAHLVPLARKWVKLLTLGLAVLAVVGVTGMVIEQAFELALHHHLGHDLPGHAERHLHEDPGAPSRDAVHLRAGAEMIAVVVQAPVRRARVETGIAIDPEPATRPRGARRIPAETLGLKSYLTGPPHRPPIA